MARKRVQLTLRRRTEHHFSASPVIGLAGGALGLSGTSMGIGAAAIYGLVRAVPECTYLAKHQATQVARGDMLLVLVDGATGDETPVDNADLNDALLGSLRQESTGGLEEYVRRAALHLIIAGEYLHVGIPAKEPGEVAWSPYAVTAIAAPGGNDQWEWSSGPERGKPLPAGTVVLRAYRPGIEDHTAADSPARDVQPILEDLILIQQLVRTLIKARLNAGLLLIPDGLSVTDDTHDLTQDGSTQDRDDIDELTEAIVQHIVTPIRDPTSAASVAPMILTGPQEALEAVRLLSLGNQDFTQLSDWRRETIVRLGQAWDAPPEQLQGKGGLNHWTGAFIENDFIAKHVAPVGALIAAFLTEGWIPKVLADNPALADGLPNGTELAFRYDVQKLRAQTDTARTAAQLRAEGLMNDDAYVSALGFEPSVLPGTEEERLAILAMTFLNKSPIAYAPMLTLLGFPTELVDAILATAGPAPAPAPAGVASDLEHRHLGMLRVAYDRALERAGSRIVSRLQRNATHEAIRARIQTGLLRDAVAILTDDDWAALGWFSRDEALDYLFRDAASILLTADAQFPAEQLAQLETELRSVADAGYRADCFT